MTLMRVGRTMQVRKQLAALDVGDEAATRILAVMACRSIADLQEELGPSEAVDELRLLFELAEGYGYGDWLEYDASVVRGLAYYTGAAPYTDRAHVASHTLWPATLVRRRTGRVFDRAVVRQPRAASRSPAPLMLLRERPCVCPSPCGGGVAAMIECKMDGLGGHRHWRVCRCGCCLLACGG